jgi:hypothetical protein
MAIKITAEKRERIGEFSKGVQFSISHCDGYIANETVSHITREEQSELKGKGFQQCYYVGIFYYITCESGATYLHDALLRDAKNIKVAENGF